MKTIFTKPTIWEGGAILKIEHKHANLTLGVGFSTANVLKFPHLIIDYCEV